MNDYEHLEDQSVINIDTNETNIVSVYRKQEFKNTDGINLTINNMLYVNSEGEVLAYIGDKQYQLRREPYSIFEASIS